MVLKALPGEDSFKENYNILKSLVLRNLFGRYKYSFLGFSWNFIFPTMMIIVYYVVFTQIRINSIPNFWIFVASALFPFNFMVTNLTSGTGCLVANAGIIKKMYFPREIIVLSQIISTFIILLIGYIIILLGIVVTGYNINFSIIYLPLLFISISIFVTGYTLLFSIINVYVRDIQYFFNSISIVFFFLTPMYFVADDVSGILSTIIWINPFTYYVEAFHQIIYYGVFPSYLNVIMCSILPITSLLFGQYIFKKLKNGIVERL